MATAPSDMGKWNTLFIESMKHQRGPRDPDQPLQPLSQERKEWLDAALNDMTKDLTQRMKEIKAELDRPAEEASSQQLGEAEDASGSGAAPSPAARQALLEELTDIVEQIDCAKDWIKLGGVPTLLAQLRSASPGVRARAAEAVAAAAQNNPFVQRAFMEGGALPPLLRLLSDPGEARVVTKGLLAVSALVRHSDPGMEALRLAGGLLTLVHLLPPAAEPQQQQQGGGGGRGAGDAGAAGQAATSTSPGGGAGGGDGGEALKQQRKALQLLAYVCAKHPADCGAAVGFGVAERLSALARRAPDAGVRAAALCVLCELAQQPDAWQLLRTRAPELLEHVDALVARQAGLGAEEREAAQEEADAAVHLAALLRRPPAGARAPLQDHVDLDPYQDGAGAARQPLSLGLSGRGGGEQQQQQQERTAGVVGASHTPTGGGLALVRAPVQ